MVTVAINLFIVRHKYFTKALAETSASLSAEFYHVGVLIKLHLYKTYHARFTPYTSKPL